MEASALGSGQQVGSVPASKLKVWAGRVLSGLALAFLILDSVMKLVLVPQVVEASAKIGFSAGTVRGIGVLLFACIAVHLNPRTAVLGAVLLTGYLGGAVATHVRLGDALFSHTLFPVYFGVMIWGGLILRDARARELLLRK